MASSSIESDSMPEQLLGPLRGVPDAARHVVARPDELSALKSLVLSGARVGVMSSFLAGSSSASPGVGLHGMGGVGKTELAKLLARDEEIRRRFPDGIYWLAIGHEAGKHPLALQVELASRISGSAETFAELAQ